MGNQTRNETFEKYKKISGTLPPIVMGIQEKNLQEEVQLMIAESYLDGYKKGKKKYKRFKGKYLHEVFEKEKLQKEVEQLKKNNESLQDKQIAMANRLGFIEAYENSKK